nr:retrotransposon Gag domain-containing protein [Tanacetum cinerariifolium]
MAKETPFTAPVEILEKGPSEPDPKEPPVGINTFYTANKNHTPDHTAKTTSENASGNPVMQFVIHNFEQINAMDAAFSSNRKAVHPTNGRFFKYLIAQARAPMEDLFMQAYNFIRANEANTENRLRDSRWVTNDGKSRKNYKETSRRHKDTYTLRPNTRPNERLNIHKPSFTPLIKSPPEIYANSVGKTILQPPTRMFAPAHKRDRMRLKEANETLMTRMKWSPSRHQLEALLTDIAFSSKDPILENCNGEDPLVIKAYIRWKGKQDNHHRFHGIAIVQGDIPCKNECLQLSQKREQESEEVTTLVQLENESESKAVEGCHQIRMAEEDEEKIAFHTKHGTFCYEKMPFRLKNAGATYQRLVNKAFFSQFGRNIEIYVDDMVIKSRDMGNLITAIEETFHTL